MRETLKTIGKNSEKIGDTTVTGDGAIVKVIGKDSDTVAVRDYVSGKGYSGIVNWDGEKPTVAGVRIEPTEVKDGIAFAKKEDIDSVLTNMEKNSGIKNAQESRDSKYGIIENKVLDSVLNRKEFTYDPESDVVYQAYKKQYEREAKHALRKILNDNNSSVATASGAVLSEAIAAYNEKMDKVTDVIPDLYKDAYSRYIDEGKVLDSNLKTINNIANDYYDRVYESNIDTMKRIVDSAKEERDERNLQNKIEREERNLQDKIEREERNLQDKIEREETQQRFENERKAENDYYDNVIKAIKAENYDAELKASTLSKIVSAENTAMKNALARGFFISSDEKAIPWLSSYRLPDGTYSISPEVASVANEYKLARARERGKIHAILGL